MLVQRTIMLSETGSTRGSLYAMSNKIVTIDGRSHVAWLDAISDTKVCMYDHATGEISDAVLVGSGVDNHGGPAMCCDSEGYLYIVFGPHHGPLQFARSVRPNDSSEWETLPEFGVNATYPSLVCDADDTLHIAYRGGEMPRKVIYQRRPKGGEWSEPQILVDAGVPDGYTQFCNALTIAPDGSLHMAYHIYDNHPAAGKAAGHMMSADGGDTWTLADGTPLDLPVTRDDDELLVLRSDEQDLRVSNVVCDDQSRPYFMTNHYRPENDLLLWSWRDGQWRSQSLRPVMARLVDFTPRFAQAATCSFAEGRLYLAISVGPQGGWNDPETDVYVLVSDDLGETFDVLTLSRVDSELPSWGPSLERPVGHNEFSVPMVLWINGFKGEGVADPDTMTEVMLGILGQ